MREDYSAGGDAWSYFPHDHARSRAYRWSEDGLAGICDDRQTLCFALAFWNGRDPILKERIFGLTGPEGNHGEDAKEYWWYLDSTPTHSWMRWRYMYPQAEFPYERLVAENARARLRTTPSSSSSTRASSTTGRYWEITADYAKASPEEILVRVSVRNAGPETATIDVLPTLWFRNTWSWGDAVDEAVDPARATAPSSPSTTGSARASSPRRARRSALFCENETNAERLSGRPGTTPYPKDGIARPRASTARPPSTPSRPARRPRSATASRSPPGDTATRRAAPRREARARPATSPR